MLGAQEKNGRDMPGHLHFDMRRAHACEMNFVFMYACRPSTPPSEP
jgi:hypothetical protein